MKSLLRELLLDCTRQAPLSMGFPRKEYWSGLPFPSPGHFPNPEFEPTSPALAGGFFTTQHQGSLLRDRIC